MGTDEFPPSERAVGGKDSTMSPCVYNKSREFSPNIDRPTGVDWNVFRPAWGPAGHFMAAPPLPRYDWARIWCPKQTPRVGFAAGISWDWINLDKSRIQESWSYADEKLPGKMTPSYWSIESGKCPLDVSKMEIRRWMPIFPRPFLPLSEIDRDSNSRNKLAVWS